MNTANIFKTINSETIKEEFENIYIDYLQDKFEDSPNYRVIYKNLDTSTSYKALIVEYDVAKNLIGYKKFVSYPYNTQLLDVGDYITFLYNGVNTNWLIFAVDKQFDYNVTGKIKKCNNNLKWIDSDGNIRTYPCVVDDKINNSDLDQNKNIIIPEGGIIVYCQLNNYTDNIGVNDRFLFGKQAFKINALIDYSSDSFITFVMQKDNIDENDNFLTGIANSNIYDYTLTINQDSFTQSIGHTTTLTSTIILNSEIVSKNIEWVSSDETKAIIDDDGNLELLTNGSVIITCRMEDNTDINDSITITIISTLPSTGDTIILPNDTTLFQGEAKTYSIYKYIDDVVQDDTFTIVASDVLTNNYNISVTDNGFTVTNIEAYLTNDLTITCTNNTTSEITVFNISLKGFW